MAKIRILFVCLGNICRSPMAEYLMCHKIANAGLSNLIETDSAGTSGEHDGEGMHCGTADVLDRLKIQSATPKFLQIISKLAKITPARRAKFTS